MNNDYLCPSCRGQLKVNNNIVFSAKNKHGEGGLLILSPELGDYVVKKHPRFNYKEGEHVDFYCPICHADLASDISENLAEIIMIDDNKKEFEIFFSEIAGEKCTYKISGDAVESYGKDSTHYINFFGEEPKY